MTTLLDCRVFRRDAEVVLYGFGGLAIHDANVNVTFPEVVSFAGPLAGLCLAGLTAATVVLNGGRILTAWYIYLPRLYAAPSAQLLLRLRGMQYYPTVMTMFGIFCISSFQLMQGESRRAISAYRRYRE